MKRISFLLVQIILIAMFLQCSPPAKEQKQGENDSTAMATKVEKVKIQVLEPQVIGKTIEYPSTLKAFEEVHLVPATPGKIDKILVEVGSRVKKGDLLVKMDQTQLLQSELQLKNLETDYKRLDTLQKVGSIAQQQFDQVKTQYEVTKANVDFLRKNVELRAPFDGVISGKYFEDGEMYSGAPNTTAGKAAVISIVQINKLKTLISVPETYFPYINTGMKANIACDIYPGKNYIGKILRIYPTIDPMSHSFQVEMEVSNSNEKLRPGMFCRVVLGLGEVKALVVPSLAVLKMQGSNERYIFIEKDGVAKRIIVNIGKRFDDLVEVESTELHKGDHLIIFGQSRLLDGVPVEITTE